MRSRWNLPIWLLYVAFCLLVLGFIVRGLQFTVPWSHPYQVTATFADADSILANNEVFMNGSRVGYVSSVGVSDGVAKVHMILSDGRAIPLYSDATAQVRKKNLLGETYIDLTRGSAGQAMASGGQIPINHTMPITEIDQVLAVFDPVTVQRVQLLIDALGEGTTNNGDRMNASAPSLNQLVTVLNGPSAELSVRRQQVQDIVLELQRFYTVLANQREQVRQEFGTWADVMQQLANQEQAIGGTVVQADTLLKNLNALVSGEGGDIRSTVAQLPTTLNDLNAFLYESGGILGNLARYRTAIHDVFPNLGSSFYDTDPSTGQHFWSVFSVNCPSSCGNASSSQTTPQQTAPNDTWAAAMGG